MSHAKSTREWMGTAKTRGPRMSQGVFQNLDVRKMSRIWQKNHHKKGDKLRDNCLNYRI